MRLRRLLGRYRMTGTDPTTITSWSIPRLISRAIAPDRTHRHFFYVFHHVKSQTDLTNTSTSRVEKVQSFTCSSLSFSIQGQAYESSNMADRSSPFYLVS
uniref:(northern house mosquito) hypothetical protein n=1 Tax=Culex pipiens TaxID=7175 RepID=A0A8D8P188_CULPI